MKIADTKEYVVIVAGGSGSRMGSGIPKQLLELDGKPILEHTVELFASARPGIGIITVLPREHFSTWKEICAVRGFNVRQTLVEGGITRFHSVKAALAKVPDGVVVAIHDGVRPLAGEDLVCRMFEKMKSCRALVPVLPVTDSLKTLLRSPDGTLSTPESAPDPDRSSVFAVQTPQMFVSEDIKAAYTQAYDTAFTDDASVARRYGIPLTYIEGRRTNIKITTPEDLRIAEAFRSLL